MKKWSLLVVFALFASSFAYADILNPIGETQKLKASQALVIPGVDPGTILADVTQIAGYLGTREGYFYDINKHEFVNYAAATIISYPQYGLSASFGALNADGVGASIDFNAGSYLPSQNVPLLNLFQYFYVGFGIGERYMDRSNTDPSKAWKFAYGPTGEFKFTF